MADVFWLIAAIALSCAAMGWFALAMSAHWQQVFAEPGEQAPRSVLRVLAAVAVLASAGCCLRADHPSIGVLVWIMLNTGAGIAVAMTLARRPGVLRALWPLKSTLRRA